MSYLVVLCTQPRTVNPPANPDGNDLTDFTHTFSINLSGPLRTSFPLRRIRKFRRVRTCRFIPACKWLHTRFYIHETSHAVASPGV